MKRLALLCLALLLCLAVPAAAADKTGKHSEKQTQKEHIPPATSFERFSAVLPQGWTGEDQSGFHSGDNREYMLMIGKKGDTSFEAALTIFILPNLKGEDAKSLAGQSAQMQNMEPAGVLIVLLPGKEFFLKPLALLALHCVSVLPSTQ